MISLAWCNINCLYRPIYCFVSSKISLKALVIVMPVSPFKGITHVYLLKISMTHNKNLIPLFEFAY